MLPMTQPSVSVHRDPGINPVQANDLEPFWQMGMLFLGVGTPVYEGKTKRNTEISFVGSGS